MDSALNGFIPIDAGATNGLGQSVADPETGWLAAGWWTGDMWAEVRPEDDDTICQLDFEPTHYLPPAKGEQ